MSNGACAPGSATAPDPLPLPYFFDDSVDGIVNSDTVMGLSVSGILGLLKTKIVKGHGCIFLSCSLFLTHKGHLDVVVNCTAVMGINAR